jgi:hypothetical protein
MIKLMPLDGKKTWHITHLTVSGGIEINYPNHLDGGGAEQRIDITKAVKETGYKKEYNRAFEWCAGFGAIGYDLVGAKLCSHIVFSDYYDVAITSCLETAAQNQISSSVTGYVSSTIAGLPSTEKWDLVVSNPPHCSDKEVTIESLANGPYPTDDEYMNNTLRILVDQDWEIHKEFFTNIQSRLADNADVYISCPYPPPILEIAANLSTLSFIAIYPMPSLNNGTGKLIHLRNVNSSNG